MQKSFPPSGTIWPISGGELYPWKLWCWANGESMHSTQEKMPISAETNNLFYTKLTIKSHPCLTFNIECCSACGSAILVLGLTGVDSSVFRKDLDEQQCVLVAIVQELALEASGESLGVFVPEDLRLGNTAHLDWEASWFSSLHRLGLHVAKDLRRLGDWTRQNILEVKFNWNIRIFLRHPLMSLPLY